MPAQRMAAREGSEAKGEGSRSAESSCAKAPTLRSGIPQCSLNLFRCVDLAATRRQTIAAVHCSFLSFIENNNMPLLRVQQRGKKGKLSNQTDVACPAMWVESRC